MSEWQLKVPCKWIAEDGRCRKCGVCDTISDMYAVIKRLVDYIEIEFEDHLAGLEMTHGLDCSVIHAKDVLKKAKGESE